MFGNHDGRLVFHRCFLSGKVALDKSGQFVIAFLLAFENNANRLGASQKFLSSVDSTILMAKHKDGGFHGIFQVFGQSVYQFQVLRLFHHHQSPFGHHGISLTKVGHLHPVGINAKEDVLVKVALLRLQHRLFE